MTFNPVNFDFDDFPSGRYFSACSCLICFFFSKVSVTVCDRLIPSKSIGSDLDQVRDDDGGLDGFFFFFFFSIFGGSVVGVFFDRMLPWPVVVSFWSYIAVTMTPVPFPDDFAFWFPLMMLFHPSLLSLLLLTNTILGKAGAFSSLSDFVTEFACPIFKFLTRKVDDDDETDMVGLVSISCGILVYFVMVESLYLLVVIKILKLPNRKRTDRV